MFFAGGVFRLPLFVGGLQLGVVELIISMQVVESGEGGFLTDQFLGRKINYIVRAVGPQLETLGNRRFLIGREIGQRLGIHKGKPLVNGGGGFDIGKLREVTKIGIGPPPVLGGARLVPPTQFGNR